MEDCCVMDAAPAAVDRCRGCGGKGRPVSRRTMESLLRPEAVARLGEGPYHFDASPDCEVVYFSNQTDSYFDKNALAVRVGIKEKEPPVPICYCFGHTADSAREEIVRTGRKSFGRLLSRRSQPSGRADPNGAGTRANAKEVIECLAYRCCSFLLS